MLTPTSIPSTKTVSAPIMVWVLFPAIETEDPNINYYYDFSQSINEYTEVFNRLGLEWKWQAVKMSDLHKVIKRIEDDLREHTPVVLNLCDGDEINGAPGISVVRELKKRGLIFTGADEYFYQITTSKIDMKKEFDKAGIKTPSWVKINKDEKDCKSIFEKLGCPIIVKPAVSGGSMGVGIKSVVHTEEELAEQVKHLYNGYNGWDLCIDGVIAEAFINGPEFTTLITGTDGYKNNCHVYPPVERVFHPSLPDTEKFLSFDRLWEIYENETPMPNQGSFYEYQQPDICLIDKIKEISLNAYNAVKGKGYTRVDLRMDKNTGEIYVLEVNAQCGLSDDEDYTSIGAILRLSNCSFDNMIKEILQDALLRNGIKASLSGKRKKIAPAINQHHLNASTAARRSNKKNNS